MDKLSSIIYSPYTRTLVASVQLFYHMNLPPFPVSVLRSLFSFFHLSLTYSFKDSKDCVTLADTTKTVISPYCLSSPHNSIGATASSVTMGMVPTINPQAGLEAGLETIVQFSLNYVILGCGVLFVAFLQCGCWNLAAEHQVRVIRTRFFRAVLSQDISWFDEKTGGELTTRISE